MELQERVELFKDEISLIYNLDIKEFVIACLEVAPDYVFTDCPSSSSGKFHPLEELSADGTIIHTKKVFSLAYELSTGLDCVAYRDEICAAALLHDLMKQGPEKSGHTVPDHPQLMANKITEVYNNSFRDKISVESAQIMYYGVFYHYGPWTLDQYKKPIKDFSPMELAVFIADFIASKRFVHVAYRK